MYFSKKTSHIGLSPAIWQTLHSHTSIMVILWILLISTGIRADVLPINKYVLEGGSICLALAQPLEGLVGPLTGLKWKLNESILFYENEISSQFQKKMDYNNVNHTLCIRNMMVNESGTYVATYVIRKSGNWAEVTDKYRLLIQKAVPIPTMQVTYSNSSTGTCNITVNCSGWEWPVCVGKQCLPSQQTLSLSDFNISVSSSNEFIQCTVNNFVSTETVLETIEHTQCRIRKDNNASISLEFVYPFVGGVIFICAFVCMAIIKAKTCKSAEDKLLLQGECQSAPGVAGEQVLGIRRRLQGCLRRVLGSREQVIPEDVPPGVIPIPQPSSESEVNSIYVTAGTPRAEAGSAAVVGPPVAEERLATPQAEELRKVGASPKDRPVDCASIYSEVQKPVVPQRHRVVRGGNNVTNTDTVYCTIGVGLPLCGLHLAVVERLVYFNEPESYAGGDFTSLASLTKPDRSKERRQTKQTL